MNKTDEMLDANINWAALLLQLKKKKLVPFLGAGASMGFNGTEGLPSGGELSLSLAKECDFPGEDKYDLLRVSQYYALTLGEDYLREAVKERLTISKIKPGELHRIIAGLPVEAVMTTNYDNLMELAFQEYKKNAETVVYNRDGDQEQIEKDPTEENPLIYKLHGSLDDVDSIIITEDNYIDFMLSLMRGNPKVPDIISRIFRTCSILFIGYGLRDWNIRVLLRYFEVDRRSFAIQRDLDALSDEVAAREWQSTVLYWEKNNISIFNSDGLIFLRELDRRFKREMEEAKND